MKKKSPEKSAILAADLKVAIDKWAKKYPPERRQSAVLPALTLAQEHNQGYLSQALIHAVADYLGMSRVTAYEVATFYTLYELEPVGQHKIEVCSNISCLLKGCDKLVKHLKERLQISLGETSVDKRFTLREVECLGACVNAPVLQIGKQYYEEVTVEKLDKILDNLDGE